MVRVFSRFPEGVHVAVSIPRFRARRYGCLQNVDIALTPIHALIGPNDSGKSTVLRAVRTVCHLMYDKFRQSNTFGKWSPFTPLPLKSDDEYQVEAYIKEDVFYRIEARQAKVIEKLVSKQNRILKKGERKWFDQTSLPLPKAMPPDARKGVPKPRGARFVRFDPDALKEPSQLIPEDHVVNFFDDRGKGLPGVYDAILNRGDDTYKSIVSRLRELFPTVKSLRLKVTSQNTKEIEIELVSGRKVPARFMSEGMLFYLAFAALLHLEPASILLVEEPENGLHPARISDVMRILRDISNNCQVLIATHSPLVINEMSGDEVSVLTRDSEKGTVARRLSDTPNFEERSRVYALGELWLSYANGEDEAPLFSASDQS